MKLLMSEYLHLCLTQSVRVAAITGIAVIFFFVCVCLSSSVTLIFAAASYAVTSALLPQNKRKRHAGLSIHGCKCIASRKSRRALGGQ